MAYTISRLVLLVTATLYICTAHAALTESEARAAMELKNSNSEQLESSYQYNTDSTRSKSVSKEGLTALSVPTGCVTGALPTTPGSPNTRFIARWTSDETVSFTIWRQPCANDPTKSAVFLRGVPQNNAFICSSSFAVIQSGLQYDSVKLVTSAGGSSFCDDMLIPATFLLDQWTFDDNFDEDKAFTLVHEGVRENNQVNVPAYSQTKPPTDDDITLSLEVPVKSSVYSGISSVQGWAVSPDGIDRVELFVDGQYWTNAPYGGQRTDVGAAFPNIPNSDFSGFVMAYGYTNLSAGNHTLTARAYSRNGAMKEDSSSFTVDKFHANFFPAPDAVNASQAQCTPEQSGVFLRDISVDGRRYDVRLQWQTATQGFEIISINP